MNTHATQDPYVGTIVSQRWRVEKPLSSGGMGAVYVASHIETGRRVALKVIKSEGAMDPEMIARFKRESTSLAAVSHPNIVTFLDSGVDDGTLYLVMELLSGGSLRDCMTQPMPWSRAFRICSDVLRGLAAVHAHGLVHRDLKPENIFLQQSVGHDDFAKLIDFGIVRFEQPRTSASVNTRTGAVIGTPGYISPETLAGRATTPLSDLYAVGVILYELITNMFPFEGDSVQAMLVRQLFEEVVPPSRIVPVPKHVDDIVMALLARDPTQRPHTAMEALSLVSRALGTATPPPPPPPVVVAAHTDAVAESALPTMFLDPLAVSLPPPALDTRDHAMRAAAQAAKNARRVSTTLRRDRKIAAATFAVMATIAIFARVGFAVSDDAPVAASVMVPPSNDDAPMSFAETPLDLAPAIAPAAAPAEAPAVAAATKPVAKSPARAVPLAKKRVAPDAAELAAFIAERRDQLLTCGGDRVPREVVISVAPSGVFTARLPGYDDVARCARGRIASWSFTPFAGAAVTTSARLAFGTKKPALPSK